MLLLQYMRLRLGASTRRCVQLQLIEHYIGCLPSFGAQRQNWCRSQQRLHSPRAFLRRLRDGRLSRSTVQLLLHHLRSILVPLRVQFGSRGCGYDRGAGALRVNTGTSTGSGGGGGSE